MEKLQKPNFDIEIKAEIKGLSKIEDNIAQVKEIALAMKEYYSSVKYETKEEIDIAVEEKKKVNSFKNTVATYRKDIIKEYKKPIDEFEATAKETESILTEVYEIMNNPVNEYRDRVKQDLIDKTKVYFEEYKTSKNIDFIIYENAQINITMNTSEKKAKEQAKAFVDKVEEDLALINTQEYSDEILVEYKNNLNVSRSIMIVSDRHRQLDELKNSQEENKKVQEVEQKVIEKVEKIVEAPKEIEDNTIYNTTFTVKGTKKQLRELVQFLKDGGYSYESK